MNDFNYGISTVISDKFYFKGIADIYTSDNENLLEVNLPNVTAIGTSQFANCFNLSKVNLYAVNTIPSRAFVNCSALSSLVTAARNVNLGAFDGCINFSILELPYTTYLGGVASNASPYTNHIEILRCVNCSTIDSMLKLNYQSYLREVYLPLITDVKVGQFSYCSNLSTLDINNAIVIEMAAFASCTKLTTLSALRATYVGSSAFQSCVKLENFNASNIKFIGDNAFRNCANLSSIELSNCLYIGENAFMNCPKLSNINISKALYIGSAAFSNTGITELCYSSYFISFGCFAYCSSLSYISIIADVIYSYAFNNCTNLNTIYTTAKVLYQFVFNGCDNIQSVILDGCIRLTGSAFLNAHGAYSISCSTLAYIGPDCFSGASVTDISFPQVTSIQQNCFKNAQMLQKVYLEACSYIGTLAFSSCTSLSQIYLLSDSVCTIANNTFNTSPFANSTYLGYYGSVYVPASLVESYKVATNWTSISNRITAYIE